VTPGPLPRRGLRLTSVFVAVLAVGLTLGWLLGGDAVAVAEVGQPAPDFSVEVIDGGTFTLSEARGQPVIVNFWASWCGPCRTEIPDISAFAAANPDVTIVGVAVQDAEQTARDFAAEIDAAYPLALGTVAVEDAYPNLGLPATYVVDANGVVTEIINGIVDGETLGSAVG
jgi:thiol-disulfide isomerase/thioredoxin